MQFFRGIYEPEPKTNGAFRLYRGERTNGELSVPYTLWGKGHFGPTEGKAIHHFRLRPCLGTSDPVFLHGGLRDRAALAKRILEQEQREIPTEMWNQLFSPLPTHVAHFAWQSLKTDQYYKIFYFPLSFSFHGHSSNGLAKRWGLYLIDRLQLATDPSDLCPPSKEILQCQQFWMTTAFNYLQYMVIDEPLLRWN